METARRHNVKVVLAVLNTEACGLKEIRVTRAQEISGAIREAMAATGSVLIDVPHRFERNAPCECFQPLAKLLK